MRITPETVEAQRDWLRGEDEAVVGLINDVRGDLAAVFDVDVASVTTEQYHRELDAVFADGDRAVNVATLVVLLRELDVADDYPGFVVDELLGRELAATIAGGQPLRVLAEATFHYADLQVHEGTAGEDDLRAALAAGFQTRLPGWPWRRADSPFAVED